MTEPRIDRDNGIAALRYAFEQAGLLILRADGIEGRGVRLHRDGLRDDRLRPE